MIDVVSGVIVTGRNVREQGLPMGRILLTQRRATQDYPFTWECAGGKVEQGETHAEALRRELREELGVLVVRREETPLWAGVVDRPGKEAVKVHLYPAYLLLDSPPPRPLEGQGIGWFKSLEVRGLLLAPANASAIHEILQWMGDPVWPVESV